jgi:hypothetical protein
MTVSREPSCWARSLGNCSGGPSREHIISKSQFDGDKITLKGLPWCKEPKTIGLASLVAKNLCQHHNRDLSPVDAEAKRFKDGLSAILRNPVLPVRLKLDARLIERWLLKTTINIALQEPNSGLDLSDEVVRRAFGLSPTPRSQGFFAVAEVDEQLSHSASLQFESWRRNKDGRLVLAGFNLRGWRALYAFDGAPPVQGALRLRSWEGTTHWLRFRWCPDLEEGDTRMTEVTYGDDGEPLVQL